MRALGQDQVSFLDAIDRHGSYSLAGGWSWGTPSATARLVSSLAKRGLIRAKTETVKAWGVNGKDIIRKTWHRTPEEAVGPQCRENRRQVLNTARPLITDEVDRLDDERRGLMQKVAKIDMELSRLNLADRQDPQGGAL